MINLAQFCSLLLTFPQLAEGDFKAKTFQRSSKYKFNNNLQIKAIIAAFGKPYVRSRFLFGFNFNG